MKFDLCFDNLLNSTHIILQIINRFKIITLSNHPSYYQQHPLQTRNYSKMASNQNALTIQQTNPTEITTQNNTGDRKTPIPVEEPTIKQNIQEDYKITFQTTEKNRKQWDYRTHVWDLKNQLELKPFLKNCTYPFKYGGCIVKRVDEKEKEKGKKVGYKIEVVEEFMNSPRILYLLTMTLRGKEFILKGGKVKGQLRSRTYPAGTEDNWTIRGSCSDTNYVWSQIFRMCMDKKIPVKFYVFQAPIEKRPYPTPIGGTKYEETSPYEAMEKDLNAFLKETLGQNLIGEGNLLQLIKN